MTCRFKSRLLALALVASVHPSTGNAELAYELEADGVAFGGVEVGRVLVTGDGVVNLRLERITHPALGSLGALSAACLDGAGCAAGSVRWSPAEGDPVDLVFARTASSVRLEGGGMEAVLGWSEPGRIRLRADALPLAWFASVLPERAGLSSLSGEIDLAVDGATSGEGGDASLTLRNGGFDTRDGRWAGAGLGIRVEAAWSGTDKVSATATWHAGEMLLGPAYLPPPSPEVVLAAAGRAEGGQWRLEDVAVTAGDRLSVRASAAGSPAAMEAARLEIERATGDIAWLWSAGLKSLAGTTGWGGLSPVGTLEASLRHAGGSLEELTVALLDAGVDDVDERVRLDGLSASLRWSRAGPDLEASMGWREGALYRLPLGAGAIALRTRPDGNLELDGPARVPILDGALVVDRLEWLDWGTPRRDLRFDARLEPIGLPALTQALGWTEFGGEVAGRFDGLRLSGGVAEVRGGLDISLFEGRARVSRLTLERPFGSLPALAADVAFSRLDLDLLTHAFEFGRMQGLASGHVRNLRLLDWRPVRFDAWFEALEESPRRQISQKAVDSLSSLSGGGGAAISGTLLRWFEDFPYRRAGLGCRLSGNVCRMRGLEDTEQGGYLILEGRAIPRLDIIGYQREVDWPRLVRQLGNL